jgi:alpha-beta hydrolase superfamily lysophospholipase
VRLPVASADGPFVLAGTLALPTTNTSAVPAVLVLGGSGSQDRDGARADLAGYRPWRELADTLTARGIAVLRLDDRGTGASTGQFVGTTTQGFADDARVALGWLRKQADIDPARVAMVGHSEGALVALLTARADTAVAALVLMGAPSRSGREIARWQRQRVVAGDLAAYPPSERDMVLARADRDADALAASDPWLRNWFALDPRVVASGVHRPVLLLHGETDQQVPVAQAGELAAVLRRAGAPVAEERFARTNHLFLPDDDGDPSGYVRLVERRMRPAALRAAARFLEGVFTAR